MPPIVGGNVSLYNEGHAGPIYPTPVIGMVGRMPDARRAGRLGFQRDGDRIALLGPFEPALAASELHKLRGRALPDGLPDFDLSAVRAAQDLVRAGVREGQLSSAHDIAEGGLAIALAECCLAGARGASITLLEAREADPEEQERLIFGEGPGGFVISASTTALVELARHPLVREQRVSLTPIGTVGGQELGIELAALPGHAAHTVRVGLDELAAAHDALRELFG